MNTDPKRNSPWPLAPIGALLERVSRRVDVETEETYREIGIRSHCKGIFHKPESTGSDIGEKRVFWVEPGCFTFNIIFAWEHAIAITREAEKGMIASHRFPMYRSKNGKLNVEYLWRYFSSSRGKHDLGVASPGGAGRNRTLGQGEFSDLQIPVPPPSVQQSVIDFLQLVDREIDLVQERVGSLTSLIRGLSDRLLAGVLRFPHFGQPALEETHGHRTAAGWIPSDWHVVQLGSLGTTYAGLSGKTKDDFGSGSGSRYIPYLNIFDNPSIDINNLHRVQVGQEERQNAVEPGDLFFTTTSETRLDVGMASVLRQELPDTYLNSFCFGFRFSDGSPLLPPFASYQLRSSRCRRAISRLSQGATRYNLSRSAVKDLWVAVPPPDEQQAITDVLDTAHKYLYLLRRQLSVMRRRRDGLLQHLLVRGMKVGQT